MTGDGTARSLSWLKGSRQLTEGVAAAGGGTQLRAAGRQGRTFFFLSFFSFFSFFAATGGASSSKLKS